MARKLTEEQHEEVYKAAKVEARKILLQWAVESLAQPLLAQRERLQADLMGKYRLSEKDVETLLWAVNRDLTAEIRRLK